MNAIKEGATGTFLQLGDGLGGNTQLLGNISLGPTALEPCGAQLGAELLRESDDVHGINP